MKNFEIYDSSNQSGNSIPSKREERVDKILSIMEITFEREKIFEDLKFRDNLRFDFYLPDFKLLIEFQGKQHYSAYESFGGDSALREQKYRDELKK